jgi:hypothetical protein
MLIKLKTMGSALTRHPKSPILRPEDTPFTPIYFATTIVSDHIGKVTTSWNQPITLEQLS